MKTRSETTRLLIALALGALVFVAGLTLARTWIPEWRLGDLPDESFFLQRHRELAARVGLRLTPGEPQVALSEGFFDDYGWLPCDMRGLKRSEVVRSLCRGMRIEVLHRADLPGRSSGKTLAVRFSQDGKPLAIRWSLPTLEMFHAAARAEPFAPQSLRESIVRQLLSPAETLGEPSRLSIMMQPSLYAPIRGASPAQHVSAVQTFGGGLFADRRPGRPEVTARRVRKISAFSQNLEALGPALRFFGVVLLFIVLLSRRRIDLVNGAILAGISLAVTLAASFAKTSDGTQLWISMLPPLSQALWLFLFWSAGESFLRTADPTFTTSLDSLRVGRLGPRAGRALLAGLAVGAGLAGLALALRSLAMAMPALQPLGMSINLPSFSGRTPFSSGVELAATAAVVLALALRLLPSRWVPWGAALAGTIVMPPLEFQPWLFEVAANFLIFAVLVIFCRRYGLTALLTAAIASYLLPAAVFSGMHFDWLPGTFYAMAGGSALIFLVGLVGLQRPPQVEAERLRPPAFMRRIDEERRIKYEMDLLARMQLGLLPGSLPEIPGWQIAARSILATEAGGDLYDFLVDEEGRLWVAAGDVAGHGYSCAIVQAMTTAALTSLIAPEKTPAEILKQVDRVIRRGGSLRNFASLALLRLDPKTGEVLLSNAGHPFPFFSVNGEVSEIPLPGLPLGQGPQRVYRDLVFHLPPGSALVFCSDGLNETRDWSETPYGFDRPREVLRTVHDATAPEMLEALLADWRSYLGKEEPPDDTTVVILRRAG